VLLVGKLVRIFDSCVLIKYLIGYRTFQFVLTHLSLAALLVREHLRVRGVALLALGCLLSEGSFRGVVRNPLRAGARARSF
jgi:hypothetical protein